MRYEIVQDPDAETDAKIALVACEEAVVVDGKGTT